MGGDSPKFTAFVQTPHGARHVIVKYTANPSDASAQGADKHKTNASLPDAASLSLFDDDTASSPFISPAVQRWKDLLLAEHLALQTLSTQGMAAAASRIVDHGGQRFLEVQRFDRVGDWGRKAVFSLAALDAYLSAQLDAQRVGQTPPHPPLPWPVVTQKLARQNIITQDAAAAAALLYAFGVLIGNTDMHPSNLSFTSSEGQAPFSLPLNIAPAYDMLPMGFTPTSAGALSDKLPTLQLHASVSAASWRTALQWAESYLQQLKQEERLSSSFTPCIAALTQHLSHARTLIGRLG